MCPQADRITFNYRFRWQGKQQRIKIGRYPDIELSDARIKAGEYRQALLDGYAVPKPKIIPPITNQMLASYVLNCMAVLK